MSKLLKQTVGTTLPAPRPRATPSQTTAETDGHSSSDSSTSSQDSASSINTIKPSVEEQAAARTHWSTFFAQELVLETECDGEHAIFRVYVTPPADLQNGPLFICHHGAGSTAMSFALFVQNLQRKLPGAGVLSLNARSHGSDVLDKDNNPVFDFRIQTLARDAQEMINQTAVKMGWSKLPPSVLIGHSLGGAVVTQLAADYALKNALIGFCVIDVVEGSAVEALAYMQSHLSSRPSTFASVDEAIQWHVRSRTVRNEASARVSVPAMFHSTDEGKLIWNTDLRQTVPWWSEWFTGMSKKFLSGRGAKLLILAGTDRLDKELMIGQMQGKFQLVVIPEAGHFVQEDVPEKTGQLLIDFYKRNDRSTLVLPPKISDLLAQGKKV